MSDSMIAGTGKSEHTVHRMQLIGCVLAGALLGALVYAWQWYDRFPASDSRSAADADRSQSLEPAAGPPVDGRSPPAATETRPTRDRQANTDTRTEAAPVYSSPSYHEGIMRVAPSVVSIFASQASRQAEHSDRRQLFAPRGSPSGSVGNSQGSGVIIDKDGLILTNFHLIDGAESIVAVQSNGVEHAAMLVGSDPETDLAVLNVKARDLPAVPIAAMPRLRVGDIVLAIGNPFGVGQTVTQGIVSATGRRFATASVWQYFVQIDAAINPGNSGGALINPRGQFVGLTSAVLGREVNAEGIGLAIPAELLVQVVPEIIADGRVRRGWLGIGVEDLVMFPELDKGLDHGAVVTWIDPSGPASTAGLALKDVIIAVDDTAVFDRSGLLLAISTLKPAHTARLEVQRGKQRRSIAVTLDERPPGELANPR